MKSTHESIGAGTSVLPVAAIEPSPTNPRTIDEGSERMKQLGATVRTHGVLQNLLVRPWPGRAGVFECVDGHRRLLAAKAVGLVDVPVRVLDLTTAQVIAIQLVTGENGEPLSALDEARGFKTALSVKESEKPIYTAESLAKSINREISYVYRALRLLELPDIARKQLQAGALAPRTAMLIARVPTTELREKATSDILSGPHRTEPLTYKEAEKVIHERYMVSLRNAPFEQGDATLDGPEGQPLACSTCPLKTGNDAEKFADVKDKNVCTSPACYRKKCEMLWDRTAAKAKAAGQRVLTEEETREVFEPHSPVVQIRFSSAYVDVNAKPTYRHVANEVEDKNLPTWREMLDEAAQKKGIKVPIVLARDRDGKVWELVQQTLAIEAARAIGEDMFRKAPANESIGAKDRFDRDAVRATVRSTDSFEQRKKDEAEATKRRMAEAVEAVRQLHLALARTTWIGNGDVWDALLDSALVHAGGDGIAIVAKYLGVEQTNLGIKGWAMTAGSLNRQALVPVLLVSASLRWNGLKSEAFLALAKVVKLDLKAIEQAVATKKSPAPKAAPAPTPGKSKAVKKTPAAKPDKAAQAEKLEHRVRELRANGKTFTDIFLLTKAPRAALKKLIKKIDAEYAKELAARKGAK